MKKRTRTWLSTVVGLGILLHAGQAWAPFHFVVIEEVFFGTEDCPNAQYVKLRTVMPSQTLVLGQRMYTYLADGTAAPDFGRFKSNPIHPEAGVAMIMGTAEAQGLFGMTFDDVTTGRLIQPDGRVCWALFGPPAGPVDCVAYGNYTGNNGKFGPPTVAAQLGMALVRQTETSNNAADFVLGAPHPENNNGETGTLGQCPPEPTPTTPPEPTPTSTVGAPSCAGDCNRDLTVTVDEILRGVNAALGEGNLESCPDFDLDGNGTATVDEIVAAVDKALNGCS